MPETDEKKRNARIVATREVAHGQPRIAGTRIMVYQVLDLLAAGKSIEAIISKAYFPDLTVADVQACRLCWPRT